VIGVVHAFGELRPALVHGDEPHENGGALDDVRVGVPEEETNFSFPWL
jgi:hypothetical protein